MLVGFLKRTSNQMKYFGKSDKAKFKTAYLRKISDLLYRLYVASQTRDGSIDNYFWHENQMQPSSISDDGTLQKPTNKLNIIDCIQSKYDISFNHSQPFVTVKIFDGAALIHILNLGIATTIFVYYDNVFKPYFIN